MARPLGGGMYATTPITDFLNLLASQPPEPGGGSAAALVGAPGAALAGMVANLTLGREKFAAAEADMEKARARAEALRQELVAAIDEDPVARGPAVVPQ